MPPCWPEQKGSQRRLFNSEQITVWIEISISSTAVFLKEALQLPVAYQNYKGGAGMRFKKIHSHIC